MKQAQIGYVTEGVEKSYADDIDAAQSADDLRRVLSEWAWCAKDALAVAKRMDAPDWVAFKAGLIEERQGRSAGKAWAKKFGAILLPEAITKTCTIADHFGVPWGFAWKRSLEEKR
jgi:hypothetical protein